MNRLNLLRGLILAVSPVVWLLPSVATAQVPPPGTPPARVWQQIDGLGLRSQLLARIASSGLTPDQIRARLSSMGYDSRMLDAYLSEGSAAPPPPSTSTLAAIRALGMPDLADSTAVPADTLLRDSPGVARDSAVLARPTLPPPTEEEQRIALRVFGLEVLSSASTQFEPLTTGAVPSDYVLGPGDELVLIITGDVEFVHTLPITREGFILIPQVGQVWVNGLTREQLREQLYTRLGQVYSGISEGPGATTHFEISLARLRTNQIYISGEVSRPGAYTVSPLASVLNALYQAGGPTGHGSFRDIHVLRGGRVVERVDLYEFLLRGDNLDRVRLEPGDVVFVPVHGTHVAARGEVIREAIFEIKPGETLLDLVTFAGGTTAPAHLQRARLTRVLPPAERTTPGVDRVVMDVDLAEAMSNPQAAPRLAPGDELRVLEVASTVRNMVSLNGSVWRPGSYEFRPGMRVSELIDAGLGLTPEAFADRAHITRMNRADSSLIMVPFSLRRDANGTLLEDPVLEEFDVVTVYSRAGRAEELPIQVTGEVREPVVERFQEGMTLRDAIIRAGGLRRSADPVVEVSRLADPGQREQGGIAQIFRIQVDSTYFVSEESARHYLGDPAVLRTAVGTGTAAQFLLRPHDRIFVRKIPQFELPRVVSVVGEVLYPGSYTLQRKDEKLRELLSRAGGLNSTAHAEGFRLYRGRNLVNVDLVAVLARADDPDNVILLPGDSLVIPEYNPVVTVQGAVNAPAAVLYKRGAKLDYYVANAGGYARNADRGRVHVRYANGSGRTSQRSVFFRTQPTPEPGSVVTVPLTPTEERTDTRALISDVAQIVGVLATVTLVALRR